MSSFSSHTYPAPPGESVPAPSLGWNDPPPELVKNVGDAGQVARSRLLEQRRHQKPPLDPNIQVESGYHQQQQQGGGSQYYGSQPTSGMQQQRPMSGGSYPASPPPQQHSHPQFAYQSSQISPPRALSADVGTGQQTFHQQIVQHQPYGGAHFTPATGEAPLHTGLPHQQMGTHPASAFTPPALQTQYQQPQQPRVDQPQQSLDAANTIFSPPNTVCFDNRPQKPTTQPDPHNYIPPTKAAGDVSLSGAQLIHFLVKATIRLQPVIGLTVPELCQVFSAQSVNGAQIKGPIQEGIQLRLEQLRNELNTGRVSDACLKRLNFVVDSIDRALYDEASAFLDQMMQTFPQEMASTWAHGVRLLIGELKNVQSVAAAPTLLSSTTLQYQQPQANLTPSGGRVSSATPQRAHALGGGEGALGMTNQ